MSEKSRWTEFAWRYFGSGFSSLTSRSGLRIWQKCIRVGFDRPRDAGIGHESRTFNTSTDLLFGWAVEVGG